MDFTIVGLGNPGGEYVDTRHNVGRILVEFAAKKLGADGFEYNKKLNAQVSMGKIGRKAKLTFVLPDTFMNKSGLSVKPLVTSKPKAHRLVVIYDDLDLLLGAIKISFNRGSGGHKGIESIVKKLGTKEFIRIRVGICPTTPSGKLKKISGEGVVIDFILGKFKPTELEIIKKLNKTIAEIISTIVLEGREVAMNRFN